ncbi:MAG: enoyl-CoA hydratase-related protein [Planktomarina sp.]
MIEPVTCTLDDNIAVLSVQADVFDMRLCQAFADTLADVLANDQVQGIVFGCTDAGTWPQVSIADVDRSDPVPLVADICATIQAAPIPVVAVLQGPAVGPAAELILAAHYRVFTRNAKLQFPGMNLGMIPGAGGTQRLARWLGAKNAMDLLFAGGALDAEAAKAVDLVDASSRSAPTTNTVKFTKNLVKQNAGPRPDSADRAPGLADPKAFQQAVDTARSGITRGDLMAKGKVIDCVEVALLLPLYAGLAFEAEAYQDCKSAVQSHGLRRSFLSTGVFEVVGQNVDNPIVIGGGVSGYSGWGGSGPNRRGAGSDK